MFRTTLCILLLWSFWTSSAGAAEIKVSTKTGCAIELNGEIAIDDIAALAGLAANLGLDEVLTSSGEPTNSPTSALCLNSYGGSYYAGRAMAEFVFRHGIATRLLPQSECYSACAIIFMAGRLAGAEADSPARSMYYNAKLGFHAPYRQHAAEETITGDEANREINAQNQIVADFIRFGSLQTTYSHVPLIQPSLIAQMMEAGPSSLAVVDNLDKAARWSIDLEGLPEKVQLGRANRIFACINFQAWALDQSAVQEGDIDYYLQQPVNTKMIESYSGPTFYELIDTGGELTKNCLVSVSLDPTSGISICSRDDFTGRNFGACDDGSSIWLPWYYGLPASVSLNEIADIVQASIPPPPRRRPTDDKWN